MGLTARQVVSTVVLEAGMVGLLGALLGSVVGVMLAGQFVHFSLRLVTGWQLPYEPSLEVMALMLALGGIGSAGAAYGPVRRAAGRSIRRGTLLGFPRLSEKRRQAG